MHLHLSTLTKGGGRKEGFVRLSTLTRGFVHLRGGGKEGTLTRGGGGGRKGLCASAH